jgi:uncharacterized protein YjbI with pentapeptide repeats
VACYKTSFRGADLSDSDLRGSDFDTVDFTGARLKNADFSDAGLAFSIFDQSDLSDLRGLETMRQRAPSTVGVDAIFRSGGKISAEFLRGAGLPDDFIMYTNGAGPSLKQVFVIASPTKHDIPTLQ